MFGRKRAVDVEMISVPKADWLALNDRVSSESARRVLGDQPASTLPAWVAERLPQPASDMPALTDEQLELIIDAHYRQVLSSAAGRKVWKKMLADVAAAERAAKIGR